MAIHNKSHHNHALMSLNKMRKDKSIKQKTSEDYEKPEQINVLHCIADCCEFLKNYLMNPFNLFVLIRHTILNLQPGTYMKIILNGLHNG